MNRKLGVFETAQVLSGEYAPFNAVAVFQLVNGPSPDIVGKSLKLIQQRHPLLKMRIVKEKSSYIFESEGTPKIPHTVIERKAEDHWKLVAEEELNKNFDLTRGTLVRCVQLVPEMPNSLCEIIITFQHSIIDASSIFQLSHELLSLGHTIRINVNKKDYSPLKLISPAEDFFPPAFKGIRRNGNTILFLARQIGDEINYRRKTRGRAMPHIRERSRCRIVPIQLSENHTRILIQQSRRNRVSLMSCCSAAMLIAFSRVFYKNQGIPLRHLIFADLRPYLKPPVSKEHIGSYQSMMRLTIFVNECQNFWELAQQVNQKTYRAAKRGDKFIAPLMSAKMMRKYIGSQKMRMGTTALSYTGISHIQSRYGDIQVESLHGFVSNFPIGPELTATARIFKKRLYWDFVYLDSDMDEDKAYSIADEIKAILRAAG